MMIYDDFWWFIVVYDDLSLSFITIDDDLKNDLLAEFGGLPLDVVGCGVPNPSQWVRFEGHESTWLKKGTPKKTCSFHKNSYNTMAKHLAPNRRFPTKEPKIFSQSLIRLVW